MSDIDQKPPDEPAQTPEEEAQEAAFLATDWIRIAIIATIGMLILALGLLITTGQLSVFWLHPLLA